METRTIHEENTAAATSSEQRNATYMQSYVVVSEAAEGASGALAIK